MKKRILVLHAQVPFVVGGAELLVKSLIDNIKIQFPDVEVDLVQLPFKCYPHESLVDSIEAWRLIDLTESSGKKIDLVIPTKFPSYAVKHPNKVLWLVHQYRQAYDLANTEYGLSAYDKRDRAMMLEIKKLDCEFINECRRVYSISSTVSERLKKYNNIDSIPLLPPTPFADLIVPGNSGDYFICISRLERIKRIDLIIQALALTPYAKLKIIGKGEESERLLKLIKQLGLQNRCQMLGYVDNETLVNKLNRAKAIIYSPLDEDYGYATLEGLLAKKPVITCEDSGEVAKIVARLKCGWVARSTPEALAEAMIEAEKMTDDEMEQLSDTGYEFARKMNWDHIINELVVRNL